MKLADDVDFEKLAKVLAGRSGADINVIVKEAGIFVLRRRGKEITMADFMKAYDKVVNVQEPTIPQAMFV